MWGQKKEALKNNDQFVGFNGSEDNPNSILVKNNNLHIDLIIDPKTKVGKIDNASISDVIAESALSTIVDNEDSVAAVDAHDKVKCYRNWLGLMKGDLTSTFEKNGKKKLLENLIQIEFINQKMVENCIFMVGHYYSIEM